MQRIEFPGSLGAMLAARLDRPAGEIRAWAIFAHCFTCTKDIFAASRIAASLTEKGIAVLRFDFTGLGASEGEFANTNFTSNVQDLVMAADFMRRNLTAPSILIGHSLGGSAVLMAAREVPEARAVVTIGSPADTAHVAHLFSEKEEEIMEKGEAQVTLVGRPFRIRKQFLDDIRAQRLIQTLPKLGKALLVMHAPLDRIVGVENAASIFGAARHPKSFVSMDDADHIISRREDAEYAANVIAAWVSRYLPPLAARPEAPSGLTIVRSTGKGRFQQHISVGRHRILADEPSSYGGLDTGPTPYDFLKMALGACKSMTLMLYARRRKIPLEGVEIRLTHDRIHATDCAACEKGDSRIDAFACEIRLTGDTLSEADRQRLLAIAGQCPVHRTLTGDVVIREQEGQEREGQEREDETGEGRAGQRGET